MANQKEVELDRRSNKENGFFRHVLETFNGRQGRKVAFGIWLFWIANGFKAKTDMPWEVWWKCVLLSGALIGFGTILDSIVSTFGNNLAGTAASRFKAVTTTKTEEVTQSVASDTAKP